MVFESALQLGRAQPTPTEGNGLLGDEPPFRPAARGLGTPEDERGKLPQYAPGGSLPADLGLPEWCIQ